MKWILKKTNSILFANAVKVIPLFAMECTMEQNSAQKKFIAPKSETKKVSFDEENQRFNFDWEL